MTKVQTGLFPEDPLIMRKRSVEAETLRF